MSERDPVDRSGAFPKRLEMSLCLLLPSTNTTLLFSTYGGFAGENGMSGEALLFENFYYRHHHHHYYFFFFSLASTTLGHGCRAQHT